MIDCIIIDDEQHAIDLLVHHVEQVPFLNLLETTTDPVEGLALLNNMQRGLVFLDVQMPNLTGIEILQLKKNEVQVIMTTAYTDYAVTGFEYAVVDYLLKPISFSRFLKAVNRLISSSDHLPVSDEQSYLFVKTEQKGKLLKIHKHDIAYIEGLGNYVNIHTNDQQQISVHLSLQCVEEHFKQEGFLRIHKSFIISLKQLSAVEGNFVKILNQARKIPIGSAYRENFFKHIHTRMLSLKKKKN
ncbi:response regulator transcription factor [Olivibacter sp. SDN3]|uniref:LytR/AlgR family response regulator transcription factor n=1 Tax=Olivibacter sp. SDN3 TaxID=2764720 RepID=UPI0016513C4F|nr:LytTR family DNA-binding domain-containing protein [Olivibacter sp. SDN3]QNL48622.1 response regulator transcription factor [Olivibacter sp. SDN3]